MRYTQPSFGEKTGDVFAQDGNLELLVGAAKSYPFMDTWPDRIFNGAVVYHLGVIEDGREYGVIDEENRKMTCSVPSAPTTSSIPTLSPITAQTPIPTKSPVDPSSVTTNSPTAVPVPSGATIPPTVSRPADPSATSPSGLNGTATQVPTLPQTLPPITAQTPIPTKSPVDPSSVTTNSPTAVPVPSGATISPTVSWPGLNGTTASSPPTILDTSMTKSPSKGNFLDESPTFSPSSPPILATVPTITPELYQSPAPRLVGVCPSADSFASSSVESIEQKDVVVDYKYALVTDSSLDLGTIIKEIEGIFHMALMAKKCDSLNDPNKSRELRAIKESISFSNVTYLGFNSDPIDEVSNENCPDDVTLTSENNEDVCRLVQGGVTASVRKNAEDDNVQNELKLFVQKLLSDATNFDWLGVTKVVASLDESKLTGSGGDPDISISAAQVDKDQGAGNDGVSSTSIIVIIVAAVVGAVLIVLALLLVSRLGKRKRRKTRTKEVFHEFPDEDILTETALSNELGRNCSNSRGVRYGSVGDRSPASSSLFAADDDEEYTNVSTSQKRTYSTPPAVVLNDQDDISIISNEKSKIVSSTRLHPTPDSPVSEISNSGSVEFVRAGQSFSTRSYQPEDTVDL